MYPRFVIFVIAIYLVFNPLATARCATKYGPIENGHLQILRQSQASMKVSSLVTTHLMKLKQCAYFLDSLLSSFKLTHYDYDTIK